MLNSAADGCIDLVDECRAVELNELRKSAILNPDISMIKFEHERDIMKKLTRLHFIMCFGVVPYLAVVMCSGP